MSDIESKDKNLFDRIGDKYAAKDTYIPSSDARRFQVETLMTFIEQVHGKSKFKNILDVGCGVGANASYLENNYDHYTGIDYSDKLIEIANEKFGNDKARFLNINLKEYKGYSDCDLIMGVGVLHHITDLDDTLKWFRSQSRDGTIFAFIEPQKGNPIIQFMRSLRKNLDKSYSEDQVFFTKGEIDGHFTKAGFRVDKLYFFGYFSIPFAQVILKPEWLIHPIVKCSIRIDRWIQKKRESRLAWNMFIISS